jgi:citrate synthase
MSIWWRQEPLSVAEQRLMVELGRAHHRCTFRENPSALAVQLAAGGSGGNYFQSIAAGLMMAGGPHGPLVETYDFLGGPNPAQEARRRLAEGRVVPGWGNSFAKGKLDPLLEPLDEALRGLPIYSVLDSVQQVMTTKGIWPNPSGYTAAAALALRVPRESTPWLAVHSRLVAWTLIFQATVDRTKQ